MSALAKSVAKKTSLSQPAASKTPAASSNQAKALTAAQAAIDKKALEPVLVDLTEAKSYADFLLVVSSNSSRGVKAIAENVIETMAAAGYRTIGIEGVREGRWALIDFGDVVVHVFDQPLREFYDLEGMWFDAPRIPLEVPPEQRVASRSHGYDLDGGEEDAGSARGY